MQYISLDVGKRHTGIAIAESSVRVALPLDTIHHKSDEELVDAVKNLVEERDVSTIVVGLPLLPRGGEGEEAEHVRFVTDMIEQVCPSCVVEYVDERETSKVYHAISSQDRDAEAATRLLAVWLERKFSSSSSPSYPKA